MCHLWRDAEQSQGRYLLAVFDAPRSPAGVLRWARLGQPVRGTRRHEENTWHVSVAERPTQERSQHPAGRPVTRGDKEQPEPWQQGTTGVTVTRGSSAQDAARYLGLPYTTLRDIALSGHLPVVRIPDGRRLWFEKRDLDRAVDAWRERA